MGIRSLKWKAFANLFWLLNTIYNLQQLIIIMTLRDFLNLVLVCNDNRPRYGSTKNKVFLGIVITFSCILYLLSRNTLKHLLSSQGKRCSGQSLQLLITGYNNSVVSCDDISIDQFFILFSSLSTWLLVFHLEYHCIVLWLIRLTNCLKMGWSLHPKRCAI